MRFSFVNFDLWGYFLQNGIAGLIIDLAKFEPQSDLTGPGLSVSESRVFSVYRWRLAAASICMYMFTAYLHQINSTLCILFLSLFIFWQSTLHF